jgi:hypothetical protein
MTTPKRAAKIAISLPPDQLAYLKAAEEAGRGSVSGHIQQLIQREREASDVEATLRRLFGDRRPGPEHESWARRALGIEDGIADGIENARANRANGTAGGAAA